jgi:adenylyltransferase/sulfurtransferase
MATFSLKKPHLASHYYVRFEPPDSSGDEILLITSERRKITLKGRGFREFFQVVIPLLDGYHTIEQIQEAVADLFTADSLLQGLELLAANHVLEEGDTGLLTPELRDRLTPQLNFFHELQLAPDTIQHQLLQATVTIVGLGGAGASTALALAAAHVGTIRCIDSSAVAMTDLLVNPLYTRQTIGQPRVDVIGEMVANLTDAVTIVPNPAALEDDAAVLAAIRESHFVICCLDAGQSSLIYKLNRACLQAGIPWTSGMASGFEGIVGPTVSPYETACYLCYKMRAVACSENPEEEFAFQRLLDRRKHDDSDRRENLSVGAGMIGNMLALEALKVLTGALEPSLLGKIAVIDFLHFSMKKHMVLRKPWCPACGSTGQATNR